ncbi:hypothetical protein QJQ58_26775 [Paenibacillus dendritiformis]|uniref:Uncharacterized protein n=1 Tax=Paenibacillus dendritiformis C454 TaxID=1131935 RepID=H3SL44_9BACL|nr:hypothetical protein [Paenibacillus dendritiformis]EHQ60197.1 hypothetical protein PDENDC454_21394 [Paenibacillus dendritiformis C454]PZM62776.1 hypothetical protein DOE73_25220 [Paenibacillus dendritiformis]TDL58097.1 hypothetical protein E2R60_06455 [Paenibacillus dendritiformis]WGU94061.1 hypothetical protein QJQ58_26775 [Paenibacillus dendritiformis]CAH8773027.1 hypothetical protein H7S4_005774 [Paenibacillus dendritiformis]
MTYVDISSISPQLFVTVLFFLLIVCPLVSLGIVRLFQQRVKLGITYIASAVVSYVVFLIAAEFVHKTWG